MFATGDNNKNDNYYWVMLTDKDGVSFDPHTFFHPLAIQRREQHGLSLYDTLDFPVREDYIRQVAAVCDSVRMVSRWFNAVRVEAQPQQVVALEKLPFVKEVLTSALYSFPASHNEEMTAAEELSDDDLKNLITQVSSMQGELFHENGYDGQGIRIAIFDAGFPGVDTHSVFSHLRQNNRIVKTWDFHRNRSNVYNNLAHGTMVLSNIAGIHDGIAMGIGTGAEFLLARTEIRREPFFEEEYWLAAVEWADQNGAHIINSSLGYSYHRYFPEQMDGETSFISQAAAIAFTKGMLIVNAAGNSGGDLSWRIISTPADSPYVLSVGSVGFPGLLPTGFSSRGPTADGRLKPEVTALGEVIVAGPKGITSSQGTSFSSPLVAGFAACLWQMFPKWTNKQIMGAIQRSGHLHPYFDFDNGYGIPQAGYFFKPPGVIIPETFDFVQKEGQLKVILREFISESENVSPLDSYLYYHILNTEGQVEQYFVLMASQSEVLSLAVQNFEKGQQVSVYFRGFTKGWVF